jgi:lipoprotein-anchoring transpeptidase ErfK/SrfK
MRKTGLIFLFTFIAATGLMLSAGHALAARVVATIDISDQRMYVSFDGGPVGTWKISTARPGYRTPLGTYKPVRLERTWYSTKYDYAPMPFSIFFRGGYAIHGTDDLNRLGRPVSHGCVRLHPDNARTLFNLVRKVGRHQSRIVVRR